MCVLWASAWAVRQRDHTHTGCVSGRGKKREIVKSIVFSLLSKGEKQKFEKLEEILRKKKKFCLDSY